MKFRTKKGTYKIWKVDTVNMYAYNTENKQELIIDIFEFNKWVDKGEIYILNSDDSFIDGSMFKLPK